jgi:hypothetical protein
MVNTHFLDFDGGFDEMWAQSWRCVNCGHVYDPVIERNRLLRSAVLALASGEAVETQDDTFLGGEAFVRRAAWSTSNEGRYLLMIVSQWHLQPYPRSEGNLDLAGEPAESLSGTHPPHSPGRATARGIDGKNPTIDALDPATGWFMGAALLVILWGLIALVITWHQ